MHPIAVLIEQMPIMEYKRETGLDIPLWTQLEDTPYTNGEVKFAGWSSAEDNEKGKEYTANKESEEFDFITQLLQIYKK
jgi:hypothetical protein